MSVTCGGAHSSCRQVGTSSAKPDLNGWRARPARSTMLNHPRRGVWPRLTPWRPPIVTSHPLPAPSSPPIKPPTHHQCRVWPRLRPRHPPKHRPSPPLRPQEHKHNARRHQRHQCDEQYDEDDHGLCAEAFRASNRRGGRRGCTPGVRDRIDWRRGGRRRRRHAQASPVRAFGLRAWGKSRSEGAGRGDSMSGVHHWWNTQEKRMALMPGEG